MYRRNYKDKRKGSPKPYKYRKNTAAKDARYSQSNFRLITYGCKRDKSPAWERDKRIIDRRRKRHSRSRSRSRGRHGHSPGHRRRSKSRERHGHSPDNRRRSKSRERHGHSPHNRRRSKSRSPDRHERRVRSKSPKERGTVEDRKPSPDDKIIENNIDDKPVVTEEEEEEINKEFHVLDIDFNIPENTKAHNTDKYECTEERQKNNKRLKAELVVRRGKPFVLKITFDREYDKKQHDLEFSFTTGDDPKPPKGTAAEFDMDENKNGVGHHSEWYAKMTENKNKTITVAITPPSNCIIGEWDFSILTSSKIKPDDRPIILKYKCPKDVTILLNPWCEHDDVYLTTTDLLKEYVLNDTGAVFQGNYKQIHAKVWNFAQFEDDILDISLHLIRSHFGSKVDSGMGDPIKLSRAITEIVNSTQGGVLEGNWSGDYEGGTSPTLWSSSKNILKQYAKTGEGVKYGQCWVFSAVTTTVCRAIGLPARSITNFASAHDSDASVSIDQEYVFDKKKDKYVKLPGGDSIWNFHVWNEVWMSRTDLGRGFDGWQVIDSTPQETSGGVYRCGPAPVVAIKRGELGRMQYDLPFVFAEVNADVIKWEKQTSSKWKKVKVETSKVGKNISTKRPDGDPYEENTSLFSFMDNKNEQRMDITNEYKYPEVAATDQSLAANIVSSTNDTTLESNAVSSITLSMPITTDGLCNLPLSLDPNDSLIYNLNYADDTSLNDLPDDDLLDDMLINCNSEEGQNEKTIQCIECTDDIALAVVESTMSTEKLLIYTAALASNMDIENYSMFQSWKKFKTRGAMSCDESSKSVAQSVADECFPIPSSSLKRKRPNKESYFVISGDEVYRQKKETQERKMREIEEKEKRKIEKAKRQLLKQEEKENKQKKREETKRMKEEIRNKLNENNENKKRGQKTILQTP